MQQQEHRMSPHLKKRYSKIDNVSKDYEACIWISILVIKKLIKFKFPQSSCFMQSFVGLPFFLIHRRKVIINESAEPN